MSYDDESRLDGQRMRGDNASVSDFSTTLIGKDGRFFGVKLSSETAQQLDTLYPVLLDWVRRQGQRVSLPMAEKFATGVLGKAQNDAQKFAGKASGAVGYGIVFSKQIFDIGGNLYDSFNSLNDLRSAVKPLARIPEAAGTNALSGDNEVVSVARNKIKKLFWNRLLETSTGVIAIAPTLMATVSEQRVTNREIEERREFEKVKNNPEALKEFMAGKVQARAAHIDSEVNHEAFKKVLADERAKYVTGYEKFALENRDKLQVEFKKAAALSRDAYSSQLQQLEKFGVDTDGMRSKIAQAGNEQARNKIIEQINRELSAYSDHYVSGYLKKQYVTEHGAFDRDWIIDRSNPEPTNKQKLEEKYRKLESNSKDSHEGAHRGKGKHEEPSEIARMAAGLGAGILSQVVRGKLIGEKLEKNRDPIALDRILHLRRILSRNRQDAPEFLTDLNGNEVGYARYIHEIFQEHQHDLGRPEISTRFSDQLDKARWDDAVIFQLKDEELNSYELAVRSIAKRIKDGRMDAIALIELVGNRNQKIVRDDGRSFGPLGSGKDEDKVKAAIKKIIDDRSAQLKPEIVQTQAEISQKLGDLTFSAEELKQFFEAGATDPQLRSFVFQVISEVMGGDEVLAKHFGMNKEHVAKLRAETGKVNSEFTDMLDSVVAELDQFIQQEPEKAKELLKITQKEQDLISRYAQQLGDGRHVNEITENRDERKTLETVISNALVGMNGKSGNPLWTNVVATARERKSSLTGDVAQHDAVNRREMEPRANQHARREITRRSGEPSEEISRV